METLVIKFLILVLLIAFLIIPIYLILKTISLWIIFKKSGLNKWISLIPFYRCIEILKLLNYNPLYSILFFAPAASGLGECLQTYIIAKYYKLDKRMIVLCTIFPIFGFPYLAFRRNGNPQIGKCKNCGYEIKGAGMYCVNCGTKL